MRFIASMNEKRVRAELVKLDTHKLLLPHLFVHPAFHSAAEATSNLPFSGPRLSESCCQRLCGLQEIAYRIANRQEPPPDQNVIRLIIKNTKEAVMKQVSDNGVRCA